MHLQRTVPDWTQALLRLPDYSLVKSVDDPSILREAKQLWAGAGRDPRKLFTCYRHEDIQRAERGDLNARLNHWRTMFRRYIDRTYLENYAPHVDFVSEANEYTSWSTWVEDPVNAEVCLQSMEAAATVWNTEYRSKRVTSPDGGVGTIPDGCRLALMAGPVANFFPEEVFELARKYDCAIDYHAYTKYVNGQRVDGDWKQHSGLWDTLEQAYKLKVKWLFGEVGPYLDTNKGWRHPDVLGGDVGLLVAAMRAWVRDIAQTAAYREGRLYGAGAWFTSGHIGWEHYQLDTPELTAIANMLRDEWRPGQPAGDETVDDELKRQLLELAGGALENAKSMIALLEGGESGPVHDLRDKTNQYVVNLFNRVFVGFAQLARVVPNWSTSMAGTPIIRLAPYTGPAIENMPLTDAEKGELIAGLI